MVAKKKSGSGKLQSGQFETVRRSAPVQKAVVRESRTGKFLVNPQRVNKLFDLGYSPDEIHRVVAPRRTLDRRKKNEEPLTLAESDRVQRLERISAMANRVFDSEEKANRWLRKPCRALDGAVPIDLLTSETGAHMVEEELHAIDYGMFF